MLKDLASLFLALAALLWPILGIMTMFFFAPEIRTLFARIKRGKLFGQEVVLADPFDNLDQPIRLAVKMRPRILSARRVLVAFLPLAGLLLVLTVSGTTNPRTFRTLIYGYLLSDGIELYESQHYAEAEAKLEKLAELEPNDWVPQLQLGAALFLQGKYAEAEKARQKAVDLAPATPDKAFLRSDLGDVLFMQNKYLAAETAYRRAIDLDGKNKSAYAGLAAALFKQGRVPESKGALRKARALGLTERLYINFNFDDISPCVYTENADSGDRVRQ